MEEASLPNRYNRNSLSTMMQQSQRSLSVMIILLACGLVPVSPLAAQIGWLGDLDKAKQEAAKTRRLVLVHFWSDHCNPCFLVERNVFSKPTVARAIHANYVPVKIQVEQDRNLVTQLRVKPGLQTSSSPLTGAKSPAVSPSRIPTDLFHTSIR